MSSGHHLHLAVPRAALPIFEAALESLGGAIVTGAPESNDEIPIDVYLAEAPGRARLVGLIATAAAAAGIPEPAVRSESLPDVDWLAKSYEGLPPIQAGRFFIYGEHNADHPRPPDAIAFRIEANQAFGTGRHESTKGCLLALEELADAEIPVKRALDMGTGSGILAFAVARLWHCPVIAADNDDDSVRICGENAELNQVADDVHPVNSEGYTARAVHQNAPYDLICANILAEPLAAMAGDLARHLAPGGRAVLSGLLDHQAEKVIRRHRDHGLVVMRELSVEGWTTLILDKPAE